MKKKALKIFGITFLILLAILIAVPFFLQGKISDIIKNKVNQNVNATLDFEDADLSLIKSFPNAYVDLKQVSFVNKAPFEGDTLFSANDIELDMSIMELFKSADEPIGIKRLSLDGAKLHVKVDKDGNANYDVALEDENSQAQAATETDEDTSFNLDLEEYSITNAEILYDDFATGIHLALEKMNHTGNGDLSLATSKLQTKTDALVSFEMDSTKYLNKNKVSLDALIGIDLKESKYTFLENKAW